MKKLIATVILAILTAGALCAQTLQVGPESLKVTGTPLSGPATAAITVWNSGTGTSYYTVSIPTASTWLAVSATSGDSTGEFDTVTATFTTTNVAAGIYTSTVTVTQTNGTVTVKTVPIRMELDEDVNRGTAIGPGSIATDPTGIAIGTREARSVAIGEHTIAIGGVVNDVSGTALIGTNRFIMGL
jgi:hypothetical protein